MTEPKPAPNPSRTAPSRRWGLWLGRALAGLCLVLALPALGETETALRGQVRIDGAVDGNLQFEAETIEILSAVSGALDARGRSVRIGPDGRIKGAVTITADIVTLQGRVAGGEIIASKVVIDGRVEGDLRLRSDDVTIGPGARIDGAITYAGSREAVIDPKAQLNGAVTHVATTDAPPEAAGGSGFWAFALLAAVAMLVAWRVPAPLAEAREAFEAAIGAAILSGLVVLIVPPLVIAFFAITLFGMPFAIVLGLVYGALLVVAEVAAAGVIGEWLILAMRRGRLDRPAPAMGAAVLGAVFLWLMYLTVGLTALVLSALLGLGLVAAHADRGLRLTRAP